MESESMNLLITLIANLTRTRLELKKLEFKTMLKADKKLDNKKEVETLIAGYKKAQDDVNEILMSIAEM